MPDAAGTLELLALELGTALKPLKDLLGADIFSRLDMQLPSSISGNPGIKGKLNQAGAKAGELEPKLEALATAISGSDTNAIIGAAVPLITSVGQLIIKLKELGDALSTAANALPPAEKTKFQDFAAKLPVRIIEYLGIGYLDEKMPTLTSSLTLLALMDKEPKIPSTLEVLSRPPTMVPRRIHLDKIPDLFNDPADYFRQLFKWGAGDFEGDELLLKVQNLLESLGLPVDLYQIAGKNVLEAYFFTVEVDKAVNPPGLKFSFHLPGDKDFNQTIDFSDLWKGTVELNAAFEAGIEGSVRPPFSVNLKPPAGNLDLELLLGIKAEKSNTDPIILLGAAGGTRLQAKSLGGSIGASASFGTAGGDVEPAFKIEIQGGKLIIDFSEGDGFLQNILSGINFEAGFEILAYWDGENGLRLEGSGGIEILIPTHIDLLIIEIKGLYFSIGFSNDAPIQVGVATHFNTYLGPLQAVVDQIGTNIPITFPENGDGNLGPVDIGFKFRPPNGVGLSIDAGVVKGGGYLFLDFDRGEYAGALELTFSEIVSLKAIGIITTRMPDGSDGFSLLIIITAEFGSGIQLGFGFKLTGVGGLLGLNRTMKLEPLAEGVRNGGINSVMFPEDVVANAQRIISDLKTYFPPEQGTFLIGPMAKIGWGTPTLISVSLGIIIEIPGNIAILGVIKIALPTDDAALLVLQVNFIGAIEFDKERLWFFASMFESRVLFITIDGEMGLLIAWGNSAEFVSSIGGFHPVFNPPALPFPNPIRISFNILNESWGKVRVMGYFAVTSNTVQFGAGVEIFFGLSAFKIEGHLAFDALFQFSPFYFIIAISASFSVKVFGAGLFSVKVKMSLEGPTPWRAKGTGSISILFFSIDVDFDITWGDKENTTLPPIAVMPLVRAEFDKIENWKAELPVGSNILVSLREIQEEEALVLHPVGTLRVSQRAIPLDITLDKVGSQKPSDANKFSIDPEGSDLESVATLQENFALAQFQEMENKQKLSRPSFEKENSGVELAVKNATTKLGNAVKRIVRYELIIIDTHFKKDSGIFMRFFEYFKVLFTHFLKGNAVAISPLSDKTKKQMVPYDEVIEVKGNTFAVANTADNKVFADTSVSFGSEALAREYMNEKLAENPNLKDEIHVIPENELNPAA